MSDKIKKPMKSFVDDIRMMRPRIVRDTMRKVDLTVQPWETFTIGQASLSFASPNNITLFVSIADRERTKASRIYQKIITPKVTQKEKFIFEKDELSELYDYFEHIQTSIVAIFTAIEALSNIAIPDDYLLEKINTKKIKEIWTKADIERWCGTSEKIGDVVPEILKIESPKKLKDWSEFKELENIRNDIIHQKTSNIISKDEETKLLKNLLQAQIFPQIHAGFTLIHYFCENDKAHYFFPIGFGEVQIKPVHIHDANEFFKKIED